MAVLSTSQTRAPLGSCQCWMGNSAQADWEANRDAAGDVAGYGESADRTLVYRYSVASGGARVISVFLREGDAMTEVLRSEVAAADAG